MDASAYERISAPFRGHERVLNTLDRVLVAIVAISYFALIAWVAVGEYRLDSGVFAGSPSTSVLVRVVLVPAISFAAMSVARALINAPRPYEVLDIVPLMHKETRGKSFPGRHVFSAGVIATAFLYVSWPLSIVFFVITAAIAYLRVVGGVHFPRDVIWGAVLGIACGIVGFWVI